MEMVVDANVLFSALIKEGTTRELLLSNEFVLYAPEFLLDEFWSKLSNFQFAIHCLCLTLLFLAPKKSCGLYGQRSRGIHQI